MGLGTTLVAAARPTVFSIWCFEEGRLVGAGEECSPCIHDVCSSTLLSVVLKFVDCAAPSSSVILREC